MTDQELRKQFIHYFDENKYKFENFCKIFLKWLGFDDIQLTQRCNDGGIDLKCTKKEIEHLNLNTIEYVVQAKCYKMENKIGASVIRNFRGTRTGMSVRRIFITTSDFTKNATEEAQDSNQPITLVNGELLISFCKSHSDTMFDVKYYFNKQKLDDLFVYEEGLNFENSIQVIEKRITKNDVRARILRIPSEYKNLLKDKTSFKLSINGTDYKNYNISSDKVYFGGVTKFYKDFILNIDFSEGKSMWKYNEKDDAFIVTIK